MKAAHRKELERNELANRLGRLASDIRKPMPRSVMFILIGLLVVIVVGGVMWRLSALRQAEAAKRWVEFEDGFGDGFMELIQTNKDENYSKAARFQFNWIRTWEDGLKKLAADPKRALTSLKTAEEEYLELAELCKGDPIWEPEALYALAIIEESRAVNSTKHLDKARDKFDELAKLHPQAAHGKRALERADKLKAGSPSRLKIEEFYKQLQFSLPQLRAK